MSWYLAALKNYAVFGGRARRKEYWMFTLFNILIIFVLAFLDTAASTGNDRFGPAGLLLIVYYLAILLPSLAVSVRRLHDTARSGWWIFISIVPLIGSIVLLVFLATSGNAGTNQYGPDPKEIAA